MKFIFRWLYPLFLVFSVLTVLIGPIFVRSFAKSNPDTQSNPVVNNTIIPFNYGDYPGVKSKIFQDSSGKDLVGSQGIVTTIKNIINIAKQLLAPILIFLIAVFGIQLIIAGGEDESFSAAANHFLYVLIGVGIVILANRFSDIFFLYKPEGIVVNSFLSSNEQVEIAAKAVSSQITLLVVFLRYVLGGIALFYVIKSGSVIIFNAEEETVQKEKEVFIYGFVGLILIMVSEALVNVVFGVHTISGTPFGAFFVSKKVDVGGGLSLIANVTNLFLAMISSLFLLTLVAGGALYTFSAGNEERGQKATQIIVGSIMGLVIAFSSYTIVAEFSSGGRPVQLAPKGVKSLTPVPPPPPTSFIPYNSVPVLPPGS